MRHLVRWTLFVLLCVAMAGQAFANCDNPAVVFPTNGSTVTPNASETVVLQWTQQVAAAQYDVYFGPVGSGCSAAPHATVNAGLTQWSPPSNEITPNTQYEWRVVATGPALVTCTPTPPQTPCSTFTTASCPVAPTISAPGNNSTVPFGNVTLDWNDVPNATSYDVYGGLDGDPLAYLGTIAASQKVLNIEPGRVVEWKVVANAPSCPGQPSAHFFFTTTCPSAPANPLTPANGATVAEGANVNFSWSNVAGATSYDVKVSPDNGGTWIIIAENHLTNFYSTDELEQGEYLWEIRVNFDGDCDPLFSTPRALTISADCSGTQAPALVSPPNNATRTSPVTFQWSAVAGVQSYRVFVQRTTSNVPVLLGTTTATEFTTSDLEGGTYDWKVVARFADCADEESSVRRVIVESNCPTTKPQLIAPANGATDITNNVLFRWSGVANATGYRVIASLDGAAEVELASTTNTQAEASVGNATNVVWSVRAIFTNNCSARSDSRSFTMRASNDGECPSNPGKATLVAPVNGATSLVSPITFDWNAVPNATGYRVFGSFNGNAAISLGFTTQTQLTADVPAGTGSWIVQTFFGDRCATTLSDRRNFAVATGATCGNAVPQLITPANGASNIDSPVEFKWGAVPDVTLYRVFVAAGDGEFSFYGETEGTSLSRLVPAGVVRWYVLASFAACPDARSATASFVVRGQNECPAATITLLTPAANATSASPVRMSWSPVAGAQFYRVWISIDGAAPVNILRTNATEADVPLPAGVIKWYVDAPRENCQAVVSSQSQFEVLKSTSCAENATPTLVSPVGTRENPAAANDPTTLLWNAVPNAIGYRIWISKNLVAFEDVALTKLTQHPIDLEPGTYAWFAQALFAGCDPTSSPVTFFRISQTTPRCPTGEPSIISPGEGTDVTSPAAFAWTAVEGAIKYRVFVSIDGSEPLLIGATDETELTHALPPGNVIVSVEAVFRECPSTFSDQVPFRIQRNQGCVDQGAELVSPANNTTNVGSPVTFVWNAVNGAVKYVLVAQVNDGAPTAIASTEATHVTREMPAGLIRWHVVTFFSGCDPVTSSHFRFTIARDQGCNNRKPILLLPNDGSEVASPVHFQWTPVPNAINYLVRARQGNSDPSIIASTTEASADVVLPVGTYEFFVEAQFEGCPSTQSARGEVVVIAALPCGKPLQPKAQVIGQGLSNTTYNLRWTPLPNVQFYEVQESTSLDFANATTLTTDDPFKAFIHTVNGTPQQYLYRVRGVSNCSEDRGPYSEIVSVFIVAPRTNNASSEIGAAGNVVQTIFLPGSTSPLQFTITTDKPWLTVTPSSGTLPIEGLTATVTADPRVLALGTNTGTIKIQYSGGSAHGGVATHAGTISTIPLSISLVTPVLPIGKGTPPPDSLIFPVVGHAQGANDSLFESDIRVTNLTADTVRYDLHFTPSLTDGTLNGRSSSIEIAPNATMALDDIVASLFGTGTTSSATGMLEVRPLTTSSNANLGFFASTGTASLVRDLTTAASSRTYNFTPTGTFGQFIPAVRFSDFVGKAANGPSTILSLQQVAQSAAFRANFGFAEASGSPAELIVRVYDTASTLLATIPVSLKGGEHRQLNGMLAQNGINNLQDGRVEVEVTSGDGKVTAYVSEVDNRTNDPLLVSAVAKGAISSNKYVIPGVAYLNNPGAFWVTDMRVFNAGATSTPATLTFYPERNPGAALTREIILEAGEIEVLDNVLVNLFGQSSNIGGAIAVTTPGNTQLNATARTYNSTANGTYGQFVPGVTPAESVGVENRALQILQVEQSSRIRTNIGLNETVGQATSVEVSLIIPDALVTPVVTINLQPNEFQQISVASFGLTDAIYNARVTVKAVGGNGRVTAYGSAIDMLTNDPTYVPAQ